MVQAPIFWAGVSSDRKFIFHKAWNKAFLPKPFARVFIEWHGPLDPVTHEMDPKDSSLAIQLESHLNAAKHQAAKQFEVG
jgi:lysophospholipid acyltransferase (LPLAT)-like uncharacterized protein